MNTPVTTHASVFQGFPEAWSAILDPRFGQASGVLHGRECRMQAGRSALPVLPGTGGLYVSLPARASRRFLVRRTGAATGAGDLCPLGRCTAPRAGTRLARRRTALRRTGPARTSRSTRHPGGRRKSTSKPWRVRLTASGVVVMTRLIEGPVAHTLVTYARGNADRAGRLHLRTVAGVFSRFWIGSVADRLVRQLEVPMLILRPHAATRRAVGLAAAADRGAAGWLAAGGNGAASRRCSSASCSVRRYPLSRRSWRLRRCTAAVSGRHADPGADRGHVHPGAAGKPLPRAMWRGRFARAASRWRRRSR